MSRFRQCLLAAAALLPIAAPARAQLETYDGGSPIMLSGVVTGINDREFTMDYGDNMVTVDMYNWEWFGRTGSPMEVGDEVVVTGKIDDSPFTGRRINAEAVKLIGEAVSFDKGAERPVAYQYYSYRTKTLPGTSGLSSLTKGAKQPASQSWVSAVGTVSDLKNHAFSLDAGQYDFVIDTGTMADVPLIGAGDKLYVAGLLGENFCTRNQIIADRIVPLSSGRPAAEPIQRPQVGVSDEP